MAGGVFVTATGTDVGKTLVSAGLVSGWRGRGIDAGYVKPVQTGALPRESGGLQAPDVEEVCQVTGLDPDRRLRARMAPCLLEPACSPHLAARLMGRSIRVGPLAEAVRGLGCEWEWLVVEGAGGVWVPLNETETMLDLAVAVGFPVLLVGHSGLGTINHVLLSLESLRRRGLIVAGVILNDRFPVTEADRYIRDDNVATIEALGGVRVVARVPHAGCPVNRTVVDRALDAWPVFQEWKP
jgi:dethiobiotin synthase